MRQAEHVLGFPCGDSRRASGTAFFCGRLAESFPFTLTKQKKGGGADGLRLYRRGRSRADGIGKFSDFAERQGAVALPRRRQAACAKALRPVGDARTKQK